jgi:hypothetical protein
MYSRTTQEAMIGNLQIANEIIHDSNRVKAQGGVAGVKSM